MFAIHEADFDGLVRLEGEIAVVAISGEVDAANIEVFAALLAAAESLEPSGVVVALDKAAYFCARAVGMLGALGLRLKAERSCSLVVFCPKNHFMCRVFRILEFPLPIAQSLSDALETASRAARIEALC